MPIGAAINGYFNGLDQAAARKQTTARNASELESLPDRTQAIRSDAQLRDRQNQTGLALADAQQDNAGKRLHYENVGLDAATARQPDELNAQSNMAHVNKVLSDHSVEDLPNAIAKHRTDRLMDTTQAQVAGIAKISELMRIGDKKQVIGFMNSMRRANPDIGLSDDVHDVTVTSDEDSGDYVFSALDSTGNALLQMTATQMQRAAEMINPRTKDDYKKLRPGETLVKTTNGLANPVYTAPPLPGTQGAAGSKPTTMEQNLSMLTARYGMSDQEALAYMNTTKTVSRDQFILKGMQDLIAIGRKPSESDISNFAALYDSTRNVQNKPANTENNDNLDPHIKTLLGIP